MEPERSDLAGFACAEEPWDAELFAVLVGEHARLCAQRLFECAPELAQRAPGLEASLAAWREAPVSLLDWDPCVGRLRAAATGDRTGAPEAAAGLALALASRGLAADWAAEFDAPRRLRFGDRLLPAARSLALRGAEDRFELRWRDGDGREHARPLNRDAQGRSATGGWEGPGSPLARVRANFRVWTPAAFASAADTSAPHPLADLDPPATTHGVDAGLALLEELAPRFADWVTRVARAVVAVQRADSASRSFSDDRIPGLLGISLPARPALAAELLVHEASHQYFHAVAWLGPLCDGDDAGLHWSPVKSAARPLDRIALAFHAFANIALLQRRLLEAGVDESDGLARDLAGTESQLAEMLATLRENADGFTVIGRAIWEPLAERLAGK